jgi:hypothetical protein
MEMRTRLLTIAVALASILAPQMLAKTMHGPTKAAASKKHTQKAKAIHKYKSPSRMY